MRRMLLAFFAAATGLQAAVVQGVVLEQMSGRPLSRAMVRISPVPGSAEGMGRPATTRSGRSGHFVFSGIQPGMYLLVATSDGYFPAAHGQRRPTSQRVPIQVAADS